ncbi:MAG: HNH endonuclease, partial [Mycobacterium sp.]
GYLTEVHHVQAWAAGGQTNITVLILACKPHHDLLTTGGWTIRRHHNGSVEWIPPPHLPLRGGINTFHHLEKFPFEQDN